jgi:hypothetical protein
VGDAGPGPQPRQPVEHGVVRDLAAEGELRQLDQGQTTSIAEQQEATPPGRRGAHVGHAGVVQAVGQRGDVPVGGGFDQGGAAEDHVGEHLQPRVQPERVGPEPHRVVEALGAAHRAEQRRDGRDARSSARPWCPT